MDGHQLLTRGSIQAPTAWTIISQPYSMILDRTGRIRFEVRDECVRVLARGSTQGTLLGCCCSCHWIESCCRKEELAGESETEIERRVKRRSLERYAPRRRASRATERSIVVVMIEEDRWWWRGVDGREAAERQVIRSRSIEWRGRGSEADDLSICSQPSSECVCGCRRSSMTSIVMRS